MTRGTALSKRLTAEFTMKGISRAMLGFYDLEIPCIDGLYRIEHEGVVATGPSLRLVVLAYFAARLGYDVDIEDQLGERTQAYFDYAAFDRVPDFDGAFPLTVSGWRVQQVVIHPDYMVFHARESKHGFVEVSRRFGHDNPRGQQKAWEDILQIIKEWS